MHTALLTHIFFVVAGESGFSRVVTSKQNCRGHTKGPLCATCIVGYDRIASVCEKCRDAEVPLRLLAVFLIIIILFCTLHLFRKKIQSLHAKYGAAWRDVALAFKIMITFIHF